MIVTLKAEVTAISRSQPCSDINLRYKDCGHRYARAELHPMLDIVILCED